MSEETATTKKGRPSWRPPHRLDVKGKTPNWRHRWVLAEGEEIDRRLAEGFVFVNPETGAPGEHDFDYEWKAEHPLDSVKRLRELVLMAIPEETAKERDAYFREQTRKQTVSTRENAEAKAREMLGPNAQVYGKTTIIE